MTTAKTSPADQLSKEIAAAQSLLQLLQDEETRLVSADVEGLSLVTGDKARLAGEMMELARHRHEALAATGFPANEAGMQAWIDSAAATVEQREAWNALLALARSGKELNHINGTLLAQHLAWNQNALNVLQGNPQGGEVYGPNGQASTKIGSRRLVVG